MIKVTISYFVIHSFELDDDFTAMYKGQFPFSTIIISDRSTPM